jgi:hypothetical protein
LSGVETLAASPTDAVDVDEVQMERRQTARQKELDRRDAQLLTTLAILQTLHAHALFQLGVLEGFLPGGTAGGVSKAKAGGPSAAPTVYLTPRDLLSFELGPFSAGDAKYLEWVGEEWGCPRGSSIVEADRERDAEGEAPGRVRVIVKRGWRDMAGVVLGY